MKLFSRKHKQPKLHVTIVVNQHGVGVPETWKLEIRSGTNIIPRGTRIRIDERHVDGASCMFVRCKTLTGSGHMAGAFTAQVVSGPRRKIKSGMTLVCQEAATR